jgi:hypothetical protein
MPKVAPFTPADLLELASTLSQKVEALSEPGPGASGHDLVIVTKSLMRGMIMQGRAFAAVSEAGLAWAAGSNLRSMFELHLDIRYMLADRAVAERLARQAVLYAMKDMAEYEVGGNSVLIAAIDSLRGLDPEAVQKFEKAWKDTRGKGHWSGLRRGPIMKALEPTATDLERRYKNYSWAPTGRWSLCSITTGASTAPDVGRAGEPIRPRPAGLPTAPPRRTYFGTPGRPWPYSSAQQYEHSQVPPILPLQSITTIAEVHRLPCPTAWLASCFPRSGP